MMQYVNTAYTLLTLLLVLLIVNYFGGFVDVPQWAVIVVLVISALVFALRMYLRFSQRRSGY